MSAAAATLTPHEAARVTALASRCRSLGQLRVLLWLLSHPWPHTREEVAAGTRLHSSTVYQCLDQLVLARLVIVAGREHVGAHIGNKQHLYAPAAHE